MALAAATVVDLSWEWVHTATIGSDLDGRFDGFTGIWVVPASPYANEAGAIASITRARTRPVPFLGTCGGFQHAILEFAQVVLGLSEAGHGETQPDASLQLISPLSCSLVDRKGTIHLVPGTRLHQIVGEDSAEEGYHCSFGLNPAYQDLFDNGGDRRLRIAARDDRGEVRAVELPGHPFFVATLFQPERRALAGQLHPLVRAFIEAAR
jgi:CTP synthase (UTP-ammonia lyase)